MTDIVDLTKKITEKKANESKGLLDRIKLCASLENCGCKYCKYRKKAGNMLYEILVKDMSTLIDQNQYEFYSHDIKIIFYDCIERTENFELEEVEKNNDKKEN